ncbi:hypothetical protein K505DRAFT_360140 [Melanomma pulvis-pyrius CBS 109.77]|uniref:CorA-like transporter domain-containing protein n=1 Tax=Melanomma pulvis-pyrius CBS 109.77 TaxID=1314802 RepID=A0A6A6XGW4_9PLEO|nr:hypothetical protein K505DRAFT_360140 [Melanomma pulvis-pyrius CBS 109.77]
MPTIVKYKQTNDKLLLESCYLARTVEQHGREGSDEPWSIRQMGIYHHRDAGTGSNNLIIFNPMKSFQQRLTDAQAQTGVVAGPEDIHILVLSHSTWQWRWYLSYWEARLARLISKAHLSQVERPRDSEASATLKIEYGDVQDVQVIHDRMNMAKFILGSNVRICECFHQMSVGLFLKELEQQLARADNLLERTKSASGLMQDILSFGGLDALRISNEIAEKDNKNMVMLTAKSQKDAKILKKITILTIVYLPASFVSQFLSMGYLKVNSASHPHSLNFAGEMWIFAVLTVTLVAFTLGLWLFLDLPSRRWKWWRSRTGSQAQLADDKV